MRYNIVKEEHNRLYSIVSRIQKISPLQSRLIALTMTKMQKRLF